MITGIFGFGFFYPTVAAAWPLVGLSKFSFFVCRNLIFVVFWGSLGGARFRANLSKKAFFLQKIRHQKVFFVFLFFSREKQFSPKEGYVCLFAKVSLCFSLAFFDSPPSLSLSLSLSLYIYIYIFLSSFVVFFLSLFSVFAFFLFACIVFFASPSWKEQVQSTGTESCLSSILSDVFISCVSCFVFHIPFSYLCFCLSWAVFSFNSQVCVKKKPPILDEFGGCNMTFFWSLVFLCDKLSFWGAQIWAIFWWRLEITVNICIQHISKSKKGK